MPGKHSNPVKELNRLPWWIAAMRAVITLVTRSFREAGRLSRRRAAIQHIFLLFGCPR